MGALVSMACSAAAMRYHGQTNTAPARLFWPVAFSNTIASPFGYASLRYISFPLLTLAKASKLIPIMAMGLLVGGRRYKPSEYMAAVLITAGIAMFTFKPGKAGNQAATNQNLGLFLVAINLGLDGYTNARQESIFKETKCKPFAMMFNVNAWSAALLAGWLGVSFLVSGNESELARALAFTAVSPEILWHVLLFSLSGAVGQTFIFTSMEEQGAVATTTICLTRKFFSILLSIVAYSHAVKPLQWAGIVVVFGGLALQAFAKTTKNKGKQKGE